MYKAILFDLDGTLTDSGPGIMRSVQYALEKIGHPEPDIEKLRCFVGPPLLEQFMTYSGIDGDTARLAITYYRERYASVGIFENTLYPGVRNMLEQLFKKGYLLAVASSKPEMFVLQVLEHFGIKGFFHVICGSEMNGGRSEKAEVVEEALRRLHMEENREQVLLVGDRKYDVLGSRECGVECIAVSYGYGSREELEETDPLTTVANPYGMVQFLNRTPMRKQNRMFSIWRCAYPVGIHFLIAQILSTLVYLVISMYSYSPEDDYMKSVLLLTAISGLLFMIPGILLYRQDRKDRQLGRMIPKPAGDKIRLSEGALYLALGAAYCILGNLIMAIVQIFLDPEIYGGDLNQAMDGKGTLELLLFVGIIAPIAEEVLFRWLVYLRLRDYMKVLPAAIISSVAFALYHGNVLQAMYTVVFAMLFAYSLEITGNLWVPVLLHIGGNSCSVLISSLSEGLSDTVVAGLALYFIIASAVIMVFGILYLKNKSSVRGYRAL